MLKNNGTTQMAIKGGNAQSGSLTTLYKGSLPKGYNSMKQQGAIILGSGGNCCATNTNLSQGTFYGGAIVAGYPSDATDDAVQANITAAGYGSSVSNTPTPTPSGTPVISSGYAVNAGGSFEQLYILPNRVWLNNMHGAANQLDLAYTEYAITVHTSHVFSFYSYS